MKKPSVYDNYEISGGVVRGVEGGIEHVEAATADETPEFWTLYGHIDGQGVEAIADFPSREAAEGVYFRITGQPFAESYAADGRLRLMHAAPELLSALEGAIPIVAARAELSYESGDPALGDEAGRHLDHMLDAYRLATGRTPAEWDAVLTRGASSPAGSEAGIDLTAEAVGPSPPRPHAAFLDRIGKLRDEGLYSHGSRGQVSWGEASEPDKLAAIAHEAASFSLSGEPVRGVEALAAIEANVEYDGLPPAQSGRLRDLRMQVDAGRIDVSSSVHNWDDVLRAVSWAVGIQGFDRWLGRYKADGLFDRPQNIPWSEASADRMVRSIVGLADSERPPGAYAVAAIEREIEYAQLPDWRREALEGLRTRIDAGELDGARPGALEDRANHALRLAEFEGRVEEYKQHGGQDDWGIHQSWEAFSEEQKLGKILREAGLLHLYSEPRQYEIIDREVDLARLPEKQRRGIEEGKLRISLGPEEYERRREAPYDPPDEASAAFKARIEEGLWKTGFTGGRDVWADWSDLAPEAKLHHIARVMDWERVPESYFRTMVGRELDVAELPEDKRAALENPKANRQILSEGFEAANDGADAQQAPGSPPLRDTTRNLVDAILLDAWPRAGAIVDFGLNSQEHYEALYHGLRAGEITGEALDAALGKGEKLTALARSAASNPHKGIVFRTSWDGILPEPGQAGSPANAAEAEPRRSRTPSEIARQGRQPDPAPGAEPVGSKAPRPSDLAKDRGSRASGRDDGPHQEKDRDR